MNLNGPLAISGSTFDGNTAGTQGGAINSYGTLAISNSTFTANDAPTGGGIANINGAMTMTASTVSGNTAAHAGGIWDQTATGTIGSSIVAGNTAASGPDCAGGPVSNGYNLIGDADGCSFTPMTGDRVGSSSGSGAIVPLLDPLASNGGKTETMALALLSPAVDRIPVGALAVDGVTPLCPSTGAEDQRGKARPEGSACDMGSYELKAPWIASVMVVSGISGSAPSVSGTIACNDAQSFTVAITLRQGNKKATGTSLVGTCHGSTPVGWTVAVAPGTFAPGAATVSFTAKAGTAKETGSVALTLT